MRRQDSDITNIMSEMDTESDILCHDSQGYVNNVMAPKMLTVAAIVHEDALSQEVSTYDTLVTPNKVRKRALSDREVVTENKKPKYQSNRGQPTPLTPHSNDNINLSALVVRLADDMRQLNESVNNRMCTFQKFLEEKLGTEINRMVDERINEQMSQFRSEVENDLCTISSKVDTLEKSMSKYSSKSDNKERNIVIRNLPERRGEHLVFKINGLIKDGLKIRNIEIEAATRKVSKNVRKPGVVIAVCKSLEEKLQILKVKRALKDSRSFKDVFIENYIPVQQRLLNANLKVIVDSVGKGNLQVRGNRIIDVSKQSGHSSRERNNNKDAKHERTQTISPCRSDRFRDRNTDVTANTHNSQRHRSRDRSKSSGAKYERTQGISPCSSDRFRDRSTGDDVPRSNGHNGRRN